MKKFEFKADDNVIIIVSKFKLTIGKSGKIEGKVKIGKAKDKFKINFDEDWCGWYYAEELMLDNEIETPEDAIRHLEALNITPKAKLSNKHIYQIQCVINDFNHENWPK